MFGDVKKVRKFIEDEHIDYAEGLQQTSILQISESLVFYAADDEGALRE